LSGLRDRTRPRDASSHRSARRITLSPRRRTHSGSDHVVGQILSHVSSPAIAPRWTTQSTPCMAASTSGEIGEIGAHDLLRRRVPDRAARCRKGAAPRSVRASLRARCFRFSQPRRCENAVQCDLLSKSDATGGGSNREVLRSGESMRERARLATHLGWLIPHMKVATSAFSTNRRLETWAEHVRSAPVHQTSICSAIAKASSTSDGRDIWPCFRFWRAGQRLYGSSQGTTSKLLALEVGYWVIFAACYFDFAAAIVRWPASNSASAMTNYRGD